METVEQRSRKPNLKRVTEKVTHFRSLLELNLVPTISYNDGIFKLSRQLVSEIQGIFDERTFMLVK